MIDSKCNIFRQTLSMDSGNDAARAAGISVGVIATILLIVVVIWCIIRYALSVLCLLYRSRSALTTHLNVFMEA